MLGFYAAYNYAEGNFITWANTKKLDDRRFVSLGLSGAAGKKISLNLEVKNALDEHVMDMCSHDNPLCAGGYPDEQETHKVRDGRPSDNPSNEFHFPSLAWKMTYDSQVCSGKLDIEP
jgi:hypothetical protein